MRQLVPSVALGAVWITDRWADRPTTGLYMGLHTSELRQLREASAKVWQGVADVKRVFPGATVTFFIDKVKAAARRRKPRFARAVVPLYGEGQDG